MNAPRVDVASMTVNELRGELRALRLGAAATHRLFRRPSKDKARITRMRELQLELNKR